tara:strand:- start:2924 stop:3091 length:168 start_codon:yes stop_codon:yes gene_type:complete
MSGKGSKQRPTNKAAFDSNYDAIFNKPSGDKHEPEREIVELPAKQPKHNKPRSTD